MSSPLSLLLLQCSKSWKRLGLAGGWEWFSLAPPWIIDWSSSSLGSQCQYSSVPLITFPLCLLLRFTRYTCPICITIQIVYVSLFIGLHICCFFHLESFVPCLPFRFRLPSSSPGIMPITFIESIIYSHSKCKPKLTGASVHFIVSKKSCRT